MTAITYEDLSAELEELLIAHRALTERTQRLEVTLQEFAAHRVPAMTPIPRYHWNIGEHQPGAPITASILYRAADGEWVRYEDHVAALAALQRRRDR